MNTNNKPNIVELPTKIKALSSHLVATPLIADVIAWAKVHKQQMELAKKVYEEAVMIIKEYMGQDEVLISQDGALLAEYKQQKSYMALDKDALKLNFADIYDICLTEHKGNRPFCLK